MITFAGLAQLGARRAALSHLLCWLCLVINAVAGPPPVITVQPTNQTVQVGGDATFVVQATSGTTLTYQWYFQGNLIPGAIGSSYMRAAVQPADVGSYYVAVSNADGTVNSAEAILTIQSAPVLSGANNLGPIYLDEVDNGGMLVSELIVGRVTDLDPGALQGIAVTAVDNANGTWQYSISGGSTWLSFGSPGEGTARLLAADTSSKVRFVPNASWLGTVTNGITFCAWDQTSGSNGGTANIINATNTVLDLFNAVSYSNNDGTQPWATDWIETDTEGGGVDGGSIKVAAGDLRVTTVTASDAIYREANLSGAPSATLNCSFQNNVVSPGSILAQVSGNGGGSYTTVTVFSGATNTGSGAKSIDISSYIATNTRIRFLVQTETRRSDTVKVHDVGIAYTVPGGGSSAFSANPASSSVNVLPLADVVTVLDGPRRIAPFTNVTYTVTVANQGPSAARNMVVSGTLDSNFTFVSASDGGTHAAGVVTWSLASLPSGEVTNLTVTVIAPVLGSLTNTVASSAVTADPDFSSNNGTAVAARLVTGVYPFLFLAGRQFPSAGFQVEFHTYPDTVYSIEASTNLVDWVELITTNSGDGHVIFLDEDVSTYPQRFYRSRQ